MHKHLPLTAGFLAVFSLVTGPAHAAFVTPSDTPAGAQAFDNWTRATVDTTYQQWRGPANGGTPALNGGGENFTTLYGLNQPDDDYYNPNGIATARYLDGSENSTGYTYGFLIGGVGNIYSFYASADFELTSPDYDLGSNATTTVILQLDVDGQEILVGPSTPNRPPVPNSVKIDGYDWTDHVELSRTSGSGGGFTTAVVEHWFRFELPTSAASHVIEFDTYDPALGEYIPTPVDTNIASDLTYGHTSVIAISLDTYTHITAIPGDLNGDGYVGLDDLQPILDHWNQNVTVGDASMGDIAGPGGTGPDGYVGLDDLQPVLDHWNEGTLPTPTTIPEPAGLTLLGLGGLALLRRKA